MSPLIQCQHVDFGYDNQDAVTDVNMEVDPGDYLCIVGENGSGKSTLMKGLLGLIRPTGGKLVTADELKRTGIGYLPQQTAAQKDFPATVSEVVLSGCLNRRGMLPFYSKKEKEIADRNMEKLGITPIRKQCYRELSGGQQQRVALARAFVIEPGVLLMDEPLSNLDAKLRVQMRTVIKKLQRRLGITTIYVTHDQEEALAISDRIAVIKEGEVMQVGSPENIYKKPQNTFVAGFIGVSNFVECDVNGENPAAAVLDIKGECTITCSLKAPFKGKGIISARPEQLFFDEKEGLPGKIVISTFLGDFIEYEIELDNGQTVQLNEYTKDVRELRPDGQRVKVNFDINAVGVYDAGTQEVISW